MIVLIVEGERVPYFVGAPEVYSVQEGEQEISGSQSESLVSQIFKELHTVSSICGKILMCWCCDGWSICSTTVYKCTFLWASHSKGFICLLSVRSKPLSGLSSQKIHGWTILEQVKRPDKEVSLKIKPWENAPDYQKHRHQSGWKHSCHEEP